MNKGKKFSAIIIAVMMCFIFFSIIDFSYATEIVKTEDGNMILTVEDGIKHYTKGLSDEEIDEILDAKINQIIQEELDNVEASGITLYSTSKPKYVTVYGAKKTTKAPYKRMAGQPDGGYQFTGGGTVNINNTGGTTFTFSYSFPTPYGSIGISAKPGKKATKVTGYSATIPASSKYHYLVYVSNTYKSKPYIIYEDSTKTKIVHKGAVSTLYSTSVDVRRVKKDNI